jgi:RimJ/RimL family protein N-acetyltransferase
VRTARARYDQREDLPLGIFDRKTRRFLGGTGLHRIDWNVRAFEIGYWIRASAAGQGYVTESTQLLTQLAFDVLEAKRVSITVAAANTRSAAVAKRLGFVYEGTLRNSIKDANGNLHDRQVFALTPEEWSPPSSCRNALCSG